MFDLARKLFLASLVLFIDQEYGSSKMLRLVVATVVSALFLAALALARPFKRSDDLYLACVANLLLTCCFCLGTVIQLCGEDNDQCYQLVGLNDARRASEFVIGLTAAMLVASLTIIILKAVTAVTAPTLRLVATGRAPILELPSGCHFHGFISHAWGTGQDQTHTVVRQLQLLMPGVRIWLDVDNLDDVGKLEESVADSATFIIFLSAGYFRSWNCRRELYAALASKRPFIVVHEADTAKGGASIQALRDECRESCVEVAPPAYPSYSGPDEVLACVFDEADPIVWVRVHDFQVESLKEIALRMLRHTPYYARHNSELAPGVAVPGEVGPFALSSPITVLVCRDNKGAFDVAREVKAVAREGRGSAATNAEAFTIREADDALERANAAPLQGRAVLLLYLNEKTFLDPSGTVARIVQTAMDRGIAIAPVAEQDPASGGCAFRQFFQQTPQVLQQPPYKLFDTLAVPLYPSSQHRKVSLRHVLRGMGAQPQSGGGMRNVFTAAVLSCARCLTRKDSRRIEPAAAEPPIDRQKVASPGGTASLPEPAPPEAATQGVPTRAASYDVQEEADALALHRERVLKSLRSRLNATQVADSLHTRHRDAPAPPLPGGRSSKSPPRLRPPPPPSGPSREGLALERVARIRTAQEKRLQVRANSCKSVLAHAEGAGGLARGGGVEGEPLAA